MRVLVVKFPGTNCDYDVIEALRKVPATYPELMWYRDAEPRGYDVVVLPGGFSYADRLRAGAIAAKSPLVERLQDYVEGGGLVLGICNGFQILVEAGLLPGSFLVNDSLRFICKWVNLRVENALTPFTCLFSEGQVIKMPIAHKEGHFYAGELSTDLVRSKRAVLRYSTRNGSITSIANPNGSDYSIAALIDTTGRVLGIMPHPERAVDPLLSQDGSVDGLLLFLSIKAWLGG
jgi:phosphoribosylformylglycinamidine synthase I